MLTIEGKNKVVLPIFEVPFSASPAFTGRSRILKEIRKFFAPVSSMSQRRLALHGLGGAGKTQIALMYARQHFEHHGASVFWINASSTEGIVADIARFCDVCCLSASTSKEKIEAFKKFLAADMSRHQ